MLESPEYYVARISNLITIKNLLNVSYIPTYSFIFYFLSQKLT